MHNPVSGKAAQKRKQRAARRLILLGIFNKKYKSFLRNVFSRRTFTEHSKSKTVDRVTKKKIYFAECRRIAFRSFFNQFCFNLTIRFYQLNFLPLYFHFYSYFPERRKKLRSLNKIKHLFKFL
jgi:hypothetical protein